MGLKENDGFSEGIVWFNGDESGENGLIEAMDMLLAKVEANCCFFVYLSFFCGLVFFGHILLGFISMDLKISPLRLFFSFHHHVLRSSFY